MEQSVSRTRKKPATHAALARIGLLALILLAASFVGYRLGWFDYHHTLEHVRRLRHSYSFAQFVIVFVLAYGIGTSFGMPGLPFTVAAGVLFGTLLGTVLSWCGAMIGATIGYWLARTIGHDVVLRWVRRFKRVDAAVEDARDFDGMLRLRLIPVLPLGTVNFVGGLARAAFGSYLGATALGVLPSTVIYTYFADSLLEGVGSGRKDAIVSLVIASTLLLLLSLAPRMLSRGNRI
jgi:uncharacterized membrane protein YdjX (TVP38/TMEM64 family)